jgi:hypothetical protein
LGKTCRVPSGIGGNNHISSKLVAGKVKIGGGIGGVVLAAFGGGGGKGIGTGLVNGNAGTCFVGTPIIVVVALWLYAKGGGSSLAIVQVIVGNGGGGQGVYGNLNGVGGGTGIGLLAKFVGVGNGNVVST